MRYVSHLFCLFYLITRSRCTHIHMEWRQFECTPAMAAFDQTSPVLVCECNSPRPDWSGHGTTRVKLYLAARSTEQWALLRLENWYLLGLSRYWFTVCHGLRQQGVWVPFWTPKPLKRTPQDIPIFLCGISKNLNLKLIIQFFHLLIIPMTLFNDIMPYFDEFIIQVYVWNMSILWSPLKIWTPKNFTTANFRHPVSKSWLRHCCVWLN